MALQLSHTIFMALKSGNDETLQSGFFLKKKNEQIDLLLDRLFKYCEFMGLFSLMCLADC